jgi:DNA modification methylase
VRSKASKILIAEAMQTFIVKSSTAKEEIRKPHFYVLNKGMNSGKPLLLPCPNCFKIETENEDFKETLYWVSFSLWRAKTFHPFLIGSVIPFIRIGVYKEVLYENLKIVTANPAEFAETVKKLRFIEMKEKQFKENLLLIQELKRAYVYKYFNNKR